MKVLLAAESVLNTGMAEPVSFALDEGGVLLVQGPSGAGKSRLLRALADLDPHEGEVFFRGKPQCDYSPCQWRRQVMYCPAQPAWWAETPADCFDRLPETAWLSAVGVTAEKLHQPVVELSSGELQRLGLLRALVRQPVVLLLDEPTSHLDPDTARQVAGFLLDLLETGQIRGYVWVSHAPFERQLLQSAGARRLSLSG